MDTNNLETKYQKLAAEYSKLRAQASVLKKAVIEEQTKSSTMRDSLRQKETALRRSEQEVDSLGFRNKQLEHRVASLQDDFANEIKKTTNKSQKLNNKLNNKNISNNTTGNGELTIKSTCNSTDPIIFEELQKKIMENAMLTSLIDDKDRENRLYGERIKDLEKQLEKRNSESGDIEKRLRKDIDVLHIRNSELETKLVEAASIIGSEDALSASGSDSTTPIHAINSTSNEDRIAFLEKEIFHWRTQYEILKITDLSKFDYHTNNINKNNKFINGPQQNQQLNNTSTVAGTSTDKNIERSIEITKEQLLHQHFSKKFEELLRDKCMAESRLNSYITECENLQTSLDNLMKELKYKDIEIKDSKMDIRTLDEDLATTRINYEEQISVLTEQVISLSEQLASSR